MIAGLPQFPSIAVKISQKGSFRKIIREDLEMTPGDFTGAYEHYKGH